MPEPETTIRAPWTPEQVAALNQFQQFGGMHPFTCGNEQHNVHYVLIARTDGWHCSQPPCGYRQDWAHAFMANPRVWPLPRPLPRGLTREAQSNALAGLVERERDEAARLRGMLAEVIDHAFAPGVRSAVTVARIRRVFDRAAAERGVVTGRPIGHAVTPGPDTGDPR